MSYNTVDLIRILRKNPGITEEELFQLMTEKNTAKVFNPKKVLQAKELKGRVIVKDGRYYLDEQLW